MKKFLQKFVLSFLTLLLVFYSFAVPVAKAQNSTWYNQPFTDWYAKVYDTTNQSEIFGERYTAAQVQWILYGLFAFPINFLGSNVQGITACVLAAGSAGINVIADVVCATKIYDFINPILNSGPWSVLLVNAPTNTNLAFSDSLTIDYKSRPLSGIKYVANIVSKFTSIPEANAQNKGFGYGSVDGLQKYWQGFRNMAYALSVLVIIVFAFMIMFRVKLSPQLVISVQSALPKIIAALILATFSYAIAGFVIDLSYVVGGLFASLMHLAGFAKSFKDAWDFIVPTGATWWTGGFYILFYMFGYTFLFFIAAIVSLFGTISGLSIYGVIASLFMILVSIWVLILMFVYTVKVPLMLLKNLISLFISIVVAPVQIVIGALVPSIGFSTWLKKIIAESLVFPLTGLFMFLAWKTLFASMAASLGQSIFAPLAQLFGLSKQQNLWAPPILGSSNDMAGILWLAVSFSFMVMIPKAVDIMKMLIMGEKFAFGTAIGEATAPLAWGRNQITRSQVGQAILGGVGLTAGANLLERVDRSDWAKSLIRRTTKYTGMSDDYAKRLAENMRAKARGEKGYQ